MAVVTEEDLVLAKDVDIPPGDRREIIAPCIFVGVCPSKKWLDDHLYLFPVPGRFLSPPCLLDGRKTDCGTEEIWPRIHVELDSPEAPRQYEVWWASSSHMDEAEHARIASRLSRAVKDLYVALDVGRGLTSAHSGGGA